MLDLASLAATPVATEPFAHVVVRDFVPPASLAAVVADLPETGGGSFPPSALRLGPHARALMQEMAGPELQRVIAQKFALDLDGAPTMVTLRGRARADRDGRIHCDSTAKRVTVLLYLNPADAAWAATGGSLRLLRGPGDLDDFAVEVPPVDGTLLVFPNAPNAWHGHRPFEGRRYVVQLNYMTADAAARAELRRHRISAFVKRLAA